MPLLMHLQAQALQGMAAAAQWGQPATPFGMAGAGMWPTYPAMVAPGYGVGSNWAAAAQLNARCVVHTDASCDSNANSWLIRVPGVPHPRGSNLSSTPELALLHFCRFGNNGFGGGGSVEMGGGAVRSPTVGPKDGAAGGELGGGPGMMSGGGWNSMMPTGRGFSVAPAISCHAQMRVCCTSRQRCSSSVAAGASIRVRTMSQQLQASTCQPRLRILRLTRCRLCCRLSRRLHRRLGHGR